VGGNPGHTYGAYRPLSVIESNLSRIREIKQLDPDLSEEDERASKTLLELEKIAADE